MPRKCLYCHKTLRKESFWNGYGYQGNNRFCTLRCGFDYAVAAVNTGRVK